MTNPVDGGVALPAEDPDKYSQDSSAAAFEAKSPRSYVTFALIGVNVAVFLAMVASGVNFVNPSGWDIVKWGGNFMPLTRSGEWWRLITAMFLHFGVFHLSFNMYALLQVGRYLEPVLGSRRFALAYFGTGIAASFSSLWFHTDNSVGAGASGAIFGLFGVLLALVTTDLFEKDYAKKMRSSVLTLVGINLVLGWQLGLDNAAHIGGLVAGVLFGYIYFRALRSRRPPPPNYSVGVDLSSQGRVRF
ncbi:MAG TPA: rhomboid family intramembrane serine protease [Candidatus Binatia bacterium]